MKRLKITLLFLSVFLETQAQKGFRTELYFDNKFKVIVLNHINQ